MTYAGARALPTFVAGCGPFPNGKGRWSHDPATLPPGERNAVASLYLALMTAESLMLAGASGPTIVEGPFARNEIFRGAHAQATVPLRRTELGDYVKTWRKAA